MKNLVSKFETITTTAHILLFPVIDGFVLGFSSEEAHPGFLAL